MAGKNGYPDNPKYFKEEMICETLILSSSMADIQKVVEVISDPMVEKITLVETKVGISNEGQTLSGYKLLVELGIKQKILYADEEVNCSIRGAQFDVLASLYVVVPSQIKGTSICDLFNREQLVVTPYIEKVYTERLDGRSLQECILVFVNVESLI